MYLEVSGLDLEVVVWTWRVWPILSSSSLYLETVAYTWRRWPVGGGGGLYAAATNSVGGELLAASPGPTVRVWPCSCTYTRPGHVQEHSLAMYSLHLTSPCVHIQRGWANFILSDNKVK